MAPPNSAAGPTSRCTDGGFPNGAAPSEDGTPRQIVLDTNGKDKLCVAIERKTWSQIQLRHR